ncbi:MAG: hypothetical protein ACR2KD_06255 [Thermoleophilaceae bacterium]
MRGTDQATGRPASIRRLRFGVAGVVALAITLMVVNGAIQPDETSYPGWWRDALILGVVLVLGILAVGAVCEVILRAPWRRAKPFLFAVVVVAPLAGVGSLALPEQLMHLRGGWSSIENTEPPIEALQTLSLIPTALAAAIVLMLAVGFGLRWVPALAAVAIAVVLSLGAREIALLSSFALWCSPFIVVEDGELPSCTPLGDPYYEPQ